MATNYEATYPAGTTIVNAQTVSAGASRTDAVAVGGHFWMEAWVQVVATAAITVTVEVLGSADAGANWSTEPLQKFQIVFAGSGTKSISLFLLGAARAIRFTGGSGSSVTYTLKAAGQKMQSL